MVLSLSRCQFLSLINPHEFEHFEPYPIGNNPDDYSYHQVPEPCSRYHVVDWGHSWDFATTASSTTARQSANPELIAALVNAYANKDQMPVEVRDLIERKNGAGVQNFDTGSPCRDNEPWQGQEVAGRNHRRQSFTLCTMSESESLVKSIARNWKPSQTAVACLASQKLLV